MNKAVDITTRGLLFDMDGVLLSSHGAVVRAWTRWAERFGVDVEHTLKITHGCRAIDTVKALRPDIDAQMGLDAIQEIEMEDVDGIVALPGVKDLLLKLPAERWTIVTSATEMLARRRLEAAGLAIPARMVSADSVHKGKPDPEPYRKGAEMLGVAPADCIVVEDAPAGVDAGRAAGSRVLGVVGTHTLMQLRHAEWRVDSLAGVQLETVAEGMRLRFTSL